MKTHSKRDIFYYYRFLLWGLIPLLLHGFYKNCYLLYKEYSSINLLLKPLVMLFGFVICGVILDKIKNKSFKPNKNLIALLIIFLILPVNIPIWLFVVSLGLAFVLLLFDKDKFNVIVFVKLITVLILFLIHRYSYSNSIETTGNYVYSFIDLIIRNQVGGFGTTNLILIIILTIYLLFNILYKKNIALLGLTTYIIFFLFLCFFIDPSIALKSAIRSSILFELVLVAPFTQYSSYTGLGQKIFGILIGLIGGAICVLLPFEGVSISILILSVFKNLIDKLSFKIKN